MIDIFEQFAKKQGDYFEDMSIEDYVRDDIKDAFKWLFTLGYNDISSYIFQKSILKCSYLQNKDIYGTNSVEYLFESVWFYKLSFIVCVNIRENSVYYFKILDNETEKVLFYLTKTDSVDYFYNKIDGFFKILNDNYRYLQDGVEND